MLCDALRPDRPGASPTAAASYYFRLTTRPVDQAPFEAARARLGERLLRRQVLAGAYRLVDAGSVDSPDVLPGGLRGGAAGGASPPRPELADRASPPTSWTSRPRTGSTPPGEAELRHDVRSRRSAPALPVLLDGVFPVRAPVVTVHDAASHALAWLGSALGVPAVPLGVDAFGQSGSVGELYELHDLHPESILNAAAAALVLAEAQLDHPGVLGRAPVRDLIRRTAGNLS